MTDFEIGWLSGIIDGEGCVTADLVRKQQYTPHIDIANTDKRTIDKVDRLLKEMGVEFTYWIDKKKNSKAKPVYHVRVRTFFAVQMLLLRIQEHLENKKEQAFWLLEFCKNRETEGKYIGELSIACAEKVRELNKKGIS